MKTLLVLIIGLCLAPAAQAQVFETRAGYAEFESKASIESFKGISRNLSGQLALADSSLDFFLDLNTIATGITLRDRQMRENFLETEKFPFAEFTGKFYNAIDLTKETPQKIFVRGTFTIHGVSKELDVVATVTPKGRTSLLATATWPLKLSDYGIEVPSLLFYRLNETLILTINVDLRRKP
jgi:polyisoprenoid-binding protein YceI